MAVPAPELTIPVIDLPIRLRLARDAAGFHQDELAELIGISRRSVVNYEKGLHRPPRPVILSWALATGIDLFWVLTGETEDGRCGACGELRSRCFCASAQVTASHLCTGQLSFDEA